VQCRKGSVTLGLLLLATAEFFGACFRQQAEIFFLSATAELFLCVDTLEPESL
jgi:hypothetical protein